MLHKRIFLFFIFLNTINLNAEDTYVDSYHDSISDSVFTLSKSIDKLLSANYDDNNASSDTYDIKDQEESPDSFFKTSKYFDETEKTFLRVNFNSLFQTRGSNDFGYSIKARLPLSRTKKSYNLFIDDLTSDNPNSDITNQSRNQSKTSVGINFFAPETLGITSKYSIGVRGFQPFVRARYNLNYTLGSWDIQPTQTFKYSSNKKYEEETHFYFDKKLENLNLLRFVMYRHTEEKESGMDYAFTAEYYHSLENHAALSISQTCTGNTKYKDFTYYPNNTSTYTTYGGIYDYATTINWRQNVWKKWFYYEISPGFNFHKQYDYKANYSLRFAIDMYFGKTYKQER